MFPSIQDDINFAGKVHSLHEPRRQSFRSSPKKSLRWGFVCLLLMGFVSNTHAQVTWEGNNNTNTGENGILVSPGGNLTGSVIGSAGYAGWWVSNGLSNNGEIHNLDVLGVGNNFVNNGVIALDEYSDRKNTMTIVMGNGSSFLNTGTFRLNSLNDVISVTGGLVTIDGGTIEVNTQNFEVGKQYLFLETDKPSSDPKVQGNLNVYENMIVAGSGSTGSVLDLKAVYGYWDVEENRYAAGGPWDKTKNQYYWIEAQRAYLYGAQGTTRNQRNIGAYVDKIGETVKQDSPLWNLLTRLDGISDDPYYMGGLYWDPYYAQHHGQENNPLTVIEAGTINPIARQALRELSGEIYSTVGIANVRKLEAMNSSLADALRSDVFKFSYIGNPNNAIRGQAVAPLRYTRWATFLGIGGDSEGTRDASGYKHNYSGTMTGFDRAFWTGARVGVYLAMTSGETILKSLHERSDTTSVMVGMYLRQEMYYGYGLVSVGFGGDEYKTRRRLETLNYEARSRFNGTFGTIYAERGIDIPIYYATIQPYVSTQFASVSQDKFHETIWNEIGQSGQYTDVGIRGLGRDARSFKVAAGMRLSSNPIPTTWGQIALSGNMSVLADLAGDQYFAGQFYNLRGINHNAPTDTKYKVFGNQPKNEWLNLGLGVHMDRNSTRMFINGDVQANTKQSLFSGTLGFVNSW